MKKFSQKSRRHTARNGQDVNRRNFLRPEQLESRLAMAAAVAAINDAYLTGIDQPLDVGSPGVLMNDISTEGRALSASLFSGPANGVVDFHSDGSFMYTPNSGFEGQDSFVYSANDGTSNSLLAAVTIQVAGGQAPQAADDAFSLSEDETLTIPGVGGVLANDGYAEGATVELVSGPASGELALGTDGGFVYTPAADYSGNVEFTYRATTSFGTSEATVTLSISAVNDLPIAANDDFTMAEDQTLTTTTSVLANDSDPEGATLTPQLASQPLHGSVTFNPDGTFTYQPNANFHGLDGFSYLVSDGIDVSEVATVTISVNSVNDSPVAANEEYTMEEDSILNVAAAGVLSNDSDVDGDTLTATIVSPPQHGTVTLNADGSFVYTPAANFSGVDGFSYQAGDGTASSDVASVTINVTPLNDPPVAVNDEYTTAEDTELAIAIPGVLLNDLDPENGTLTPTMVNPPQHGTVTLGSDGGLIYTPNADFNGLDGFSYTVSDGELTSDVASVTITVTPVNDAPLSQADAYEVAEDAVLTVSSNGVLSNDTDVDGDTLTAALGVNPTHGTVVLATDGTFTYTPNADFSGADSFTYIASDGNSPGTETTVTINVTPVNDAPTSQADAYEVAEDNILTVSTGGVLANDTDPEGATLTAVLGASPQRGTVILASDGTFIYTPNADFSGQDSFTYTASDGELSGSETTVTITVTPENDKPLTEDDAYSANENTPLQIAAPGVLENDSDSDGDALTAAIVTGPTNGTVTMAEDGSFLYTPNAGFAGTDTFTYAASDGAEAATAVVTIVVNDVIAPPLTHGDAYNVAEDMALDISGAGGVLANDFDPQGLAMTAEIVTPPEHGTLTLNSDGSFHYVPNANYHGGDSFIYRAKNSAGETTEGTATILVETVNDVPNAGDDSFTVAAGGVVQTTAATGVMTNDSDVENGPLTATLLYGPAHGTIVFGGDGSFTYTPAAGYVGNDEFFYQLNDGIANSNVARATISVTPAFESPNSRPVAVNDMYTMLADAPFTIAASGVLANDVDSPGSTLLATLFAPPQHGSVTLNSDGSFTYSPQAGYVGTDSFLYWVSDGTLSSALAAVTLRIEANPVTALKPAADDGGMMMSLGDDAAFDCVLGTWA